MFLNLSAEYALSVMIDLGKAFKNVVFTPSQASQAYQGIKSSV